MVTENRSFLDLIGYYRRFVQGFSLIAAPLTRLTRKGVKFEWDDVYESRFQELKNRLTSTPILTLLVSGKEFVVYSYASKLGLRELQKFDDELKQEVQMLRDGETNEFRLGDDVILMIGDRVCVPNDDQLRRAIMAEAHSSAYALHPISTKMYKTIKESYWWSDAEWEGCYLGDCG
ncbi:Integrase zinc-binding domain - like 10 [Theobroma cacao]|nr:Integrase zinc-binding domain - like 10 [Theobroma cacao]